MLRLLISPEVIFLTAEQVGRTKQFPELAAKTGYSYFGSYVCLLTYF